MDSDSAATVCVTFRYPDGSREYTYLETLPIRGESISRLGTDYIVVATDTDRAGHTMVTLVRQSPLTKPGGDLVELAPAF